MTTGSAATARQVPEWLCIAAVVAGASVMGFSTVSARFAYDGGSDVTTMLAIRFVVMAVVFFGLARALGLAIALPRELRLPVFGLGIAFTLSSWGYIGSIAYIPVSLAVVLMYTNPLVVALLAFLLNGEHFTASRAAAVLLAFSGIAVMMGVSLDGLDWRGVALVSLGSVAFAVSTVGGARIMRTLSVPTLSGYLSAIAALAMIGASVAGGGFNLPHGTAGWIGTAGVTLSFMLGFLGYFFGVKTIGETRSAVIANLEPVVSVTGAFVLLGESFTPVQALGATLTLGGVSMLVMVDARRKRSGPT